jgi:hypothetical protein
MTVLRVDTIAGIGQTFGPLLDGDLEFNSQNYIVLPKGSSNQQGVLRTTEDVIGVGGTHYDNLVLAMPFNEATGLRDVSSRNRNPGTYDNVAISTAQSKYYGSSVYFDGSGDYLTLNGENDFAFGTGDFTIEGWFYLNDNSSSLSIYDSRPSGSNGDQVALFYSGSLNGVCLANNGTIRIQGTTDLNTGEWYHITLCRYSNISKLFINGSQDGTDYSDTTDYQNPSGRPYIGLSGGTTNGSNSWNGYIQDLRIYKGIAKYTADFTPPERIAETGVGFKTGALRYNTDSNKPELYDGNQWTELQLSSPALGRGADTGPGARGVVAGGRNPGVTSSVEYFNISSTGDSATFGNLTASRMNLGGFSSSTRGVFVGGETDSSVIDYITFSSTGSSASFGNLSNGTQYSDGTSNSTRGLAIHGFDPGPGNVDTVEYVTIASTGTISDFGNLTEPKRASRSSSSPTRAVIGGGLNPAGVNSIDFMTISTLGDAQDFGELTTVIWDGESCSNATRALWAGGSTSPTNTGINVIQYVTIATTGNASNFGDLTEQLGQNHACSSSTRGVWAGGNPGSSPYPKTVTISYVTLLTEGNAVDFGDLLVGRDWGTGVSNAHGGL